MKDNAYIFGTNPIDMSYINPVSDKMIQFELSMKYPYRFFIKLTKEEYEDLKNNPNKWINKNFTDEEILEYCKKAIESFSIKFIK